MLEETQFSRRKLILMYGGGAVHEKENGQTFAVQSLVRIRRD
jgi:hypothetical protein